MYAPALIDPALNLLRQLEDGLLFTPWAEKMCGQPITADVERQNPPYLAPAEITSLGPGTGLRAALRRAGYLVQADGTKVARVESVVAAGRLTADELALLATTGIPLGKALGPHARGEVMWTAPGTDEYAVHCGRRVIRGGRAVALTTDRVLWSWLATVSGPAGSL